MTTKRGGSGLRVKPTDKIYWLRVVLGVAAGLLAGSYPSISSSDLFGFPGAGGVAMAVVIYIVSYYIARFGIGVTLEGRAKSKFATTGIGSFIMLFLFSWILINTLYFHQ